MNSTFKVPRIEIAPCPLGLELEFSDLFTPDAILFLVDLVTTFQNRVEEILRTRRIIKLRLDESLELPGFSKNCKADPWRINPLPPRLQNRHLDLGLVAPCDAEHLKRALQSPVQGIQIDFDDGNCPTWRNTIQGIYNIVAFCEGQFFPEEVPPVETSPILMLRPRAWNMNEHNILINGREIAGALMDFGLLVYHVGERLVDIGAGPFFYLSKVEGALEARLWNDIFVWAQKRLEIPIGTIKACVLIESILASFEMDEILFELREHSLGLNCGVWDYAASFVNKFGHRPEFILPDRNKYDLDDPFLANYVKLVIQTCRKRGAPATGGMATKTLAVAKNNEDEMKKIIDGVCMSKLREIQFGLDGFLVYDTELVPWLNDLWENNELNTAAAILHTDISTQQISAFDLLKLPIGRIRMSGLRQNIKVGILFIYSWLANARGHFVLDGAVEDSATAEFSRSQTWQWIYHQSLLEDRGGERITKALVTLEAHDFVKKCCDKIYYGKENLLEHSMQIFLELVTASDPPEFMTTHLYNNSIFRRVQHT